MNIEDLQNLEKLPTVSISHLEDEEDNKIVEIKFKRKIIRLLDSLGISELIVKKGEFIYFRCNGVDHYIQLKRNVRVNP